MEEKLMKTKTQKIVMASLLAALCCVATMIIKIPSPLKGYLNLGDCVVLLSGWILSPTEKPDTGLYTASPADAEVWYQPSARLCHGRESLHMD